MKIDIEHDVARDLYGVYVFEKHNKVLYVAAPQEIKMVEVKNYKPFSSLPDLKPFLEIDGLIAMDFFGELFKALIAAGFKDQEDLEQIKSVLKAKEFHLEDMRKLVFKKKGE